MAESIKECPAFPQCNAVRLGNIPDFPQNPNYCYLEDQPIMTVGQTLHRPLGKMSPATVKEVLENAHYRLGAVAAAPGCLNRNVLYNRGVEEIKALEEQIAR